jgi:hypothetical protein
MRRFGKTLIGTQAAPSLDWQRAGRKLACCLLLLASMLSAHAGAWRLQGTEEYRSPPYNRPGGRFAQADPFCPGHVIDIEGEGSKQSFVVRKAVPGDCHNRNGARGLEVVRHDWTTPPAVLVPGQAVALQLRSTVVTMQNVPLGRVSGQITAGFVPFVSPNAYGEAGGGEPGRAETVAQAFVDGAAGTTAMDDGLRPAQRAEPLRMPEAPWLGSERFQGRLRLRIHAWHGSGIWASTDYIYGWDAAAGPTAAAPPAAVPPPPAAVLPPPAAVPPPPAAVPPPPAAAGARPAAAAASGGIDLGQVWSQSENGWAGTWTRRGASQVFDAVWVKDGVRVTAVLTITPVGARGVHIHRRDTSGSNFEIEYAGLVDPQGQVQGVGLIVGQNVRDGWSATIRR